MVVVASNTTMQQLDITPFGFTPTENAVYRALIELGPSGGYPLSNALGIARANIYQALKGLVSKDAAILVQEKPAEYRAISADALYAKIVNTQARLLNVLESQIDASGGPGEPTTTRIDSHRGFVQMVLRDAARTSDSVRFLAPGSVVHELAPAWRKRSAEALDTELWCIGQWDDADFELAGTIREDIVSDLFDHPIALYSSRGCTMVFDFDATSEHGYWTNESLSSKIVEAAIEAVLRA